MKTKRKGPMPIEERAKRYLESLAKYGGKSRAKAYRQVGEIEQCQIAGQVLGTVLNPGLDGIYYLDCPGASFHTGKNGRKDCRFTPGDNGHDPRTAAPSLHCLHQSCGTVIAEFNRRIRSEIGKARVEYLTDHGSTLNNAAAALVIYFDMDPDKAQRLLVAWGKTCTPVHTALACGKAVERAVSEYKKHPDEVGCFLKPSAATAPATPPRAAESVPTVVSGRSNRPELPEVPTGPILLGAAGKLARLARSAIENYRDDYGEDPDAVLVGNDQPDPPATLCGLPVERMNRPGISVLGGTV